MNPEMPMQFESGTGSLKRQFIASLVAMLLFAVIAIIIVPMVKSAAGEKPSYVFYMVSRLLGFLILGGVLRGWANRNRIQCLTSVFVVGFFDQVLLKSFLTRLDMQKNPEMWAGLGVPTNPVDLVFGLTQGFLYFAPILLILCFFGMELSRFVFKPKTSASLS